MANKILKTLTLPNAQGEPVTYELHPEWDNIENKPNFDDLGGVGEAYEAEGEKKGEIFNDYQNNIAFGAGSHAEGFSTIANGDYSHAEGDETRATGAASHAEGSFTNAWGYAAHAEGQGGNVIPTAITSESTDDEIIATWKNLISETQSAFTLAKGTNSHTEGTDALAIGNSSHAEGSETIASRFGTHAEGARTVASGHISHAEGFATEASGYYSHAEGMGTVASEYASHAEGHNTLASSNDQHVQGRYNIEDTDDTYAHIVGNGSSTTRSNAHTLDWDGNAWFAGAIEAKNISNPNLLDNWYFAKAVNQRGAESYWEEGFSIDRWKFSLWHSSGAYVFPTNSDVTLHNETATDTACSCYIEQTLENPKYLAGKTVTFSAKLRTTTSVSGKPILRIYTDNGVFKSDYLKTSDGGKIVTLTATLPTNITTLAVGIGAFANYAGSGNFNLAIESVKLEVGAVSTLANDVPPKYSEQLRECQRYYIRWSNTAKQQAFSGGAAGTAVYAAVQLPTAMRGTATPTVTYAKLDIYNFVSNGAVATKSCGCNMLGSRNSVVLWVTYDATSACPGQTPASIRIGENGYIALSCEI